MKSYLFFTRTKHFITTANIDPLHSAMLVGHARLMIGSKKYIAVTLKECIKAVLAEFLVYYLDIVSD